MATVFLARDLALDRKVAIKVMSPALAATADAIERFRREARVAAALSHPHIIPIHAIGEEPGLAYYVMKFVEGRTLDSVLRTEGKQSVAFVRTVLVEIGNALHYAHQRGVVHRDIKPANIMLDTDGWLVVTDFGIAKRDDAAGLTQSGMIIGTPFYMSPEQFNGQPVTGAADQYALGIVAYELLVGRTPFGGPSLGEVMKGHLLDPVPPLDAARADVPPELEACITRMLDKDPAQRFATLAEAVQAAGALTPSVERDMRTQIVELARTGARMQPRMAVPASPLVQPRPSATRPAATRPAVTGPAATRPSATRPAAPGPVAPPSSRRALIALGALLITALSVVLFTKPDWSPASAGPTPRQNVDPPPGREAPRVEAEAPPVTPAPAPRQSATPPATPPASEVAPANRTAAAESLAAIAQQALRDSIDAAARAVRNRVGNSQRRQSSEGAAPGGATNPIANLGLVRIGSSTPRTSIQVNARAPRLLPNRGLQNLPLPSGPVRLVMRAPNCAQWDTTLTLAAGQRLDLGVRQLRCRQ